MISLFGFLMPFLRTGRAFRTEAFRLASHARKRHQKVTSANCMIVKVTGMGNDVKMALDEVFVMIEVMYQKAHRPYKSVYQRRFAATDPLWYTPTTNFIDTGALSDSAISCTFSLMLAPRPRVLTVLMASLKLFCRPCLVFAPVLPGTYASQPFSSLELASRLLRAGHRSLECSPGGSPLGRGRGLGPREMSSASSSNVACSCTKSGNLNLLVGLTEEERLRSVAPVACGLITFADVE